MPIPILNDLTPDNGVEIFDLPAQTDLQVGDCFVVIDVSDTTGDANGTTKKITAATVLAGLQFLGGVPRVKRVGTQHANATVTGTKVTDLDIALEIGTYIFNYYMITRSATATTGIQFGVNFTGTGTPIEHFRFMDNATVINTDTHAMDDQGSLAFGTVQGMANRVKTTTAPNMGTTVGFATAATDTLCMIEGLVIVTVAGNLELWHSSETTTSTTVEVGSSLMVVKTA